MTTQGDLLWQPSPERIASAHLTQFARGLVHPQLGPLPKDGPLDYAALHRWSIAVPEAFWGAVATYSGIKWLTPPAHVLKAPLAGRMRGARWFEGGRLNYAQNLLEGPWQPDDIMLIAHAEGAHRRAYTCREVREAVLACAGALRQAGIEAGDPVAGVVANTAEAVIAMLATAMIGAIWASTSPDFGAHGILDRLGQIGPKVVFFTGSYVYNGKLFDTGPTMTEVLGQLKGCVRAVRIDPILAEPWDQRSSAGHGIAAHTGAETGTSRGSLPPITTWPSFLAETTAEPPTYVPLPFDAPLFILFSSGTTGVPKCMMHSVGGTLIQHRKEHLLHCDLSVGERLFYYTTCGWMMWNWMVSALAGGTSLVLYDGAVGSPTPDHLWRIVGDEGVTAFGTSPKYLSFCMSHQLSPQKFLAARAGDPREGGPREGGPREEGSTRSRRLRTLLATGAPLLVEHFAWVYREVASDLHLASISGGTDIVSCFMLGIPVLPVYAGEIQGPGLGMAIEAWDSEGRPVVGQKGELVCVKPFPSMPTGFWRDASGELYYKAYFAHYGDQGREIWRHGDFVEITQHGGIVVYGRSDATLNPGGVRIGTAELYRVVEGLPGVVDSLAVGHREDGDTAIILFVKLESGQVLTDEWSTRIRTAIRSRLTARHVPKRIFQVTDIPYTRSGKKVELAVTQVIHGETVTNLMAIANPDCLGEFEAIAFSLRER